MTTNRDHSEFKAKCHEDKVVGPSMYVRDVDDLKGNQSYICPGKTELRELQIIIGKDKVKKKPHTSSEGI
jgi:hypothetical protein